MGLEEGLKFKKKINLNSSTQQTVEKETYPIDIEGEIEIYGLEISAEDKIKNSESIESEIKNTESKNLKVPIVKLKEL